MHSIVKFIGITPEQLKRLQSLMESPEMRTKRTYWAHWLTGSCTEGEGAAIRFADIVDAKLNTHFQTFTVIFKLLISSEPVWAKSDWGKIERYVTVYPHGNVYRSILSIVAKWAAEPVPRDVWDPEKDDVYVDTLH